MVFSVQPRMITDTGQHAAGTIKSMMHTAAHCSNYCTSWLQQITLTCVKSMPLIVLGRVQEAYAANTRKAYSY